MPDDDTRDGLRIGGWVPPYRDADGPLDAPVYRRERSPLRRGGAFGGRPRAVAAAAPHRRSTALAVVATMAVLALTVLTLSDPDEPAPQAGPAIVATLPAQPPPAAPVSMLPAPPTQVASTARISASPSRRRLVPTRPAVTGRSSPARRATRPAPVLAAGATVGLALAGRPGDRLRHRDFRARIDRLGAGSTPLEKADSRFTVRRGLAGSSCFSFESVNFPGRFLRHRDFVLRLEGNDRSALFARDATFCPEPPGGAFVLRSANYPDRTLVARDGGVHLDRAGGTAFVVRPPL